MTGSLKIRYDRPLVSEYVAIGAIFALGIALIVSITSQAAEAVGPRGLVKPMLALFALTSAVWLAMVLIRNGAVIFRRASVKYYRDYKSDAPDEWIERPARTFNNLMQVPTLFYVISILMMLEPHIDISQIRLAWMFVATRALHAIVYICFNYVPVRFAIYAVSCIVLGVIWARYALGL